MVQNEENHAEKIARLAQAIQALPVELQHAIDWAISNYDKLEEIGKLSNMSSEEIQRAMERALAEEHYAALMLLHFTKFAKDSKENEEF